MRGKTLKIMIAAFDLSLLLASCGKSEVPAGGDDIMNGSTANLETEASLAPDEKPTEAKKTPSAPAIVQITDDNWELVLVSVKYRLEDGYVPKLAVAVEGYPQKMDEKAAPYYGAMYEAALKDGCNLTPYSGYRSYERQKNNYNRKVDFYKSEGNSQAEAERLAAEWILPPGSSEHNMGVAMDIVSTDENFDKSKEFKWLMENAAEYGFILRYPKDKTEITKVAYEPWHWRYVGREEALKIKESGLCLEEYLGIYNE